MVATAIKRQETLLRENPHPANNENRKCGTVKKCVLFFSQLCTVTLNINALSKIKNTNSCGTTAKSGKAFLLLRTLIKR
jgi:hypothetical protein